jgi:pyrimidine operon attenuation protein/uracil phosphoribosyltransferase
MSAKIIAMPRIIYNAQQIAQGMERIAQSLFALHPDPRNLGLIGIHQGGTRLIKRVESHLARAAGLDSLDLDKGLLDISFYRDDYTRLSQFPVLRSTEIPYVVDGRRLVLVDDVIFTGRTVRAAMDAIFSIGRPASVELAVLVDRGHREFPIAPDHVGYELPTLRDQSVNVYLNDDIEQDYATIEDSKYLARQAS